MNGFSIVAHAHTRHSYDCLSDPYALVERAARLGIHVLAITDHDTWQGSVEAEARARAAALPVRIVRGNERATDQGDVIGLFLKEDVREKEALAFCDAVHAQGGLVLLPHPFRGRAPSDALLARVDLIEAFNARTVRSANRAAAALAATRGLPVTAGPDAHRVAELDLARVEFETAPGDLADDAALKRTLLTAPRRLVTRGGSPWNEWRSQLVKCWRQPDGALALHLARGAVRRIVKPAEYAVE